MHSLEKRLLQMCVGVAATVPVAAGACGVFYGLEGRTLAAASHARYLSGLLLAIGLAFWTTIPDIEQKTERIHLLAGLVVIGGLCRLLGVMLGDMLTPAVAGALIMELLVTPSLCLWQARLALRQTYQ